MAIAAKAHDEAIDSCRRGGLACCLTTPSRARACGSGTVGFHNLLSGHRLGRLSGRSPGRPRSPRRWPRGQRAYLVRHGVSITWNERGGPPAALLAPGEGGLETALIENA